MPGGASLSRRVPVLAAALAVVCVSGCTDRLYVEAPSLTGQAATVCAELRRLAPEVVDQQPARPIGSSGVVLAWGSPAIVMRCGVTAAVGLGPTSHCYEVDGVGWYAEDLSGSYRFTTIGRAVPVEVSVPSAYTPEANALFDLAAPVRRSDPLQHACV